MSLAIAPRVTVIIPAYNAARYLPDALSSVLRQTFADWEVIVVDDGSTDDTRSLVHSSMRPFDGRLKYIYQDNRGVAAARNAGIQSARGELIALLDADDVWLPHRLEKGIALLDSDPSIGLVHGEVARINTAGEIIEYPPRPARQYMQGDIARHIYTRRAHLLCVTVLFRKACVDSVGLFDEAMRATEDRDLWFRIAERYRVGHVDEIVAYYRVSPNSASRDWQGSRTWQTYFIEKHRARGAVSRLTAREAFGNMYRERGDAVFNTGDIRESLRWYFESLRFYPMRSTNLYMFARAVAELGRLRMIRLIRPDPKVATRL